MTAGTMDKLVRLERSKDVQDELGGIERYDWDNLGERWAEWRFVRGQEAQTPGGQSGTAVFKARLYSEEITRTLTTADRVVDLESGEIFNIRAVDRFTDRDNVWLDLTGGGAT